MDKSHIDHLEKQLKEIEQWIRDNKKRIEQEVVVDNKPLKEALITQLRIQSEVSDHFTTCSYLLKEYEVISEQFYSLAIDRLINNKNKDYTSGEAKAVVHSDQNYINAKRMYNRAYKVYSQLKYLLELITTRKYVMNNLTNSIINSVEDHIL